MERARRDSACVQFARSLCVELNGGVAMGVRHAFAVLLALLTGAAAFAGRENLLKNPGAEQGEAG